MPTPGIIPSLPDNRDFTVSTIIPSMELPKEVRLDRKLLSIRDQGWWPTCVAKSAAGIMSAGFGIELAAIPIYSLCKQLDGIPHLEGTYPRTAMKVMQKHGTCLDQTMPYSLMNMPMPELSPIVLQESAKYRIATYARALTLNDIKMALANNHLLLGCMLIGDNFIYHNNSDVIGYPTGDLHGYHALKVCGYSDELQALRIANTWSERWGEGGYAWLTYSILRYDLHWPEAWVVEVVHPVKPINEIKTAEDFYPDRIFRDLRRFKKN